MVEQMNQSEADRMDPFRDPECGTGRTTKQMRDAPHGAAFVWPVWSTIGYARDMDATPGRPNGGGQVAVVEPGRVALRGREGGQTMELGDELANCLSTGGGGADRGGFVLQNWRVRRITPMEAERLQGFRDDYTRIPWKGKAAALCPDGPRYRAIGNSKAIPVVWWVGQRIQLVDQCPWLFDL
jgi:site-specific DNA-cytosine methylase